MATKTPKTSKAPYSYEAFVKNWSKATNVAEVVAATGLTRNTVSAMSTRLRKEGVKLKMMPRRVARPVDVSALNKIIKDTTA
jgi:hypothetical protein